MHRLHRFVTRHGLDGMVIVVCFVVAAAFAHRLSVRLDTRLGTDFARDVWFQADLNRTVGNMTSRFSYQYRAKVHPIASMVAVPLTRALSTIVPQERFRTAQLLLTLLGGAWAAGIFALCRMLGGSRIAGVAFTAVGVCSAAFVFWYSVPETYGLGSLTILAALIVAAWAERRMPSTRTVAGFSAATLSITVTNWMAGLALAFAALPWRRAVRATLWAFVVIAVLSVVQLSLMPTSQLFFLGSAEEAEYVNAAAAGHWWNKLTALLLHAYVMPTIHVTPVAAPFWPQLTVQTVAPALRSLTAAPALLAWMALLALGAWGGWRSWREGRRRVYLAVLLATLLGQLALHLLYGEETFLYVLHLMPLLVGLAMLGAFTPLRAWAVALALVAAPLAAVQNVREFDAAATTVAKAAVTERSRVLDAMASRPGDRWPRGLGHVVLGEPGSPLDGKAYHEPGAAFSPAPGSFGVSLWAFDAGGHVLATSETLQSGEIEQRFLHGSGAGFPALRTVTPYFTAEWRHVDGRSELRLGRGSGPLPATLRVMLRSVGPAGGPIEALESRGRAVRLNGLWTVALPDATAPWHLADESVAGGLLNFDAPTAARAESRDGWLVASAPLDPSRPATLTITRDAAAPGVPSNLRNDVAPLWQPLVPDAEFAASALAQQAHLLIGLTDGATRPGEPMNYTFPWIRDAAYVVVALARSGQTAIARRLALQLAEHDFSGGFGAEADGPGLSTWAIGEVARVLRDPGFDRAVWPHVQRKMGIVASCIEATGPVLAMPQNPPDPILPERPKPNTICERPWRGLIVGRMDNGYPVHFVNATAVAGLTEAAALADRMQESEPARRWATMAGDLKTAWQKVYQQPQPAPPVAARPLARRLASFAPVQFPGARRAMEIEDHWLRAGADEHTYVNGEWPVSMTSGSAPARAAYRAGLARRWDARRDAAGGYRERPLWTYFEIAEAHQWLLLGEPERAWQTLRWFFRNSSSPGLFSWWEGQGEENSSGRWAGLRGWVLGGGGVTPHYWTAAEALLLQLDMLARVDETDPARPLVIGSGVPSAWAAAELDSGTVSTARGPVRWRLSGDEVVVEVEDPAIAVRLGPGLAGKPVRVVRGPVPAAARPAP